MRLDYGDETVFLSNLKEMTFTALPYSNPQLATRTPDLAWSSPAGWAIFDSCNINVLGAKDNMSSPYTDMANWQKTNLSVQGSAVVSVLGALVGTSVDLYAGVRVSSWAVVLDLSWKSAFNDVRVVNSSDDNVVPGSSVDG